METNTIANDGYNRYYRPDARGVRRQILVCLKMQIQISKWKQIQLQTMDMVDAIVLMCEVSADKYKWKQKQLQKTDTIDAIVLMRGVSADKYLFVCKYKYQNGNKYKCKR